MRTVPSSRRTYENGASELSPSETTPARYASRPATLATYPPCDGGSRKEDPVVVARYAFAVLAWAVVAAIVVQVFLIGLGLFADSSSIGTHENVGWIVHLMPILVVVAALLARAGRRRVLFALLTALVVFSVPLVISAAEAAPAIAALHPVLALIGFACAVGVALSATRLALSERRPSEMGAAG
jgi:hypothetical protein